jgi:atypical dual specificity phosphatase
MKRWVARAIHHPTLAYNVLLGRIFRVRKWWDVVDERLILGAMPFRGDARFLKALGVTGVVNLCEEYRGPLAEYAAHGIEQLWLPTIDFSHPPAEFIRRGAEFIEQHAQQSGCVYVHCKAGRARSATVALWWLVRFRGMTPDQAQQLLLRTRPHVNPRVHLRPVIQQLYTELQQAESVQT